MADFKFADDFIPKIVEGIKIQTVRKDLRCKPGEVMNLMNSEGVVFGQVPCVMTVPVVLTEAGIHVTMPGYQLFMAATKGSASDFAVEGGFDNYYEMFDWFAAEYFTEKFYGFAHRW